MEPYYQYLRENNDILMEIREKVLEHAKNVKNA